MTPLGLDDQEVADVMNYILNSWGNEAEAMITEAEVAEVSEWRLYNLKVSRSKG